jgi:hypothetical protein
MLVMGALFFAEIRGLAQRLAHFAQRKFPTSLRLFIYGGFLAFSLPSKVRWSGKEDSNLRPLPPEDSALPG